MNNDTILIRVDASIEMGTGHLMRCLALAQAWKDDGGKVIFVTACNDERLLERLREESFDIYSLPHSYPDPGDWNYLKEILATNSPQWVVLDGYHFNEVYQRQVKKEGYHLFVIDDNSHLEHYYADILLNQNLHAKQLFYSCEPYTRLLLGTRYVLLRREFLAYKDWRREIPEVARRVLVTLGGSDSENHTLKVIQALQDVNIADLEVTVVIGSSNPHIDILEEAKRQSHIPILLIQDAINMPKLIAEADVVISASGSTVWELAYMKVPTIVVVLALNQEPIAKFLQQKKLAIRLNLKNDTIETQAKLLQNILACKQARLDMSRDWRLIVDGEGAQHIVGLLDTKEGGLSSVERENRIN